MMDPLQRDKLLTIIEEQPVLAERFCNARRIDPAGGNGSFSILLRAEDQERNGQEVALKFRNPFEQHEYRIQCFHREPEMLRHFVGQRDIIQLVAGEAHFTYTLQPVGFPIRFSFYAIELAVTDLETKIDSLSIREKLLHLRSMVRAVQRLHSRDVVHRDIKPSNFLVMPDATVKLSDFGTARFVDQNRPGLIADYRGFPPGDLGYTAPEILASLHDVDPRVALKADIFSLAASAFELFTGVPLGIQLFDDTFRGLLLQAMAAVRRGDRQRTYDQFVEDIEDAIPLPSTVTFAPDLPDGIIAPIDELYRSAAALDYRKRLGDFSALFMKIDRCILILDNEEKVRRWRARRDREHAATMSKKRTKDKVVKKIGSAE